MGWKVEGGKTRKVLEKKDQGVCPNSCDLKKAGSILEYKIEPPEI